MSDSDTYFYSYRDSAGFTDTDVPDQLRVGLALKFAPRYILTADWMQYQFLSVVSDFSFNPMYEGAQARSFDHYGLGIEKQGVLSEYLPYYRSLTYRGGVYFEQHYMADSQGRPVQTLGLTLGIGVPFTEYRKSVSMRRSSASTIPVRSLRTRGSMPYAQKNSFITLR
ncbi:MAG: hypothetical protein U5N26_08850 [Candidatus Marinimicrobia bacterium]|nr:hypothetical protein [Candidatus Neomarinimicrobiota bacterium]